PRSRIVRRGNEAGQQQAERYHGLTTTSVSTGPPSVPSDFLAPQPLSLIAALTGSTRVAGALCGHASSLASESPRPPGNAAWWTVATVWKSECDSVLVLGRASLKQVNVPVKERLSFFFGFSVIGNVFFGGTSVAAKLAHPLVFSVCTSTVTRFVNVAREM